MEGGEGVCMRNSGGSWEKNATSAESWGSGLIQEPLGGFVTTSRPGIVKADRFSLQG